MIAVTILLSARSITNTAKSMYSKTHAVDNRDSSSLQAFQGEFEGMVHDISVESRTVDQYINWKGMRYRLGSSTKKSIDYSNFVQHTFRKQFGLEFLHSTYGQQGTGRSISCINLHTGDLALSRADSAGHHVGIYIGNNQFTHTSTNNGVIISSVNEPYWKERCSEAYQVLSRNQFRLATIPQLS